MPVQVKIFAEILGTFMMIFIGAGAIILSEKFPQTFPPFIIPVAWGLIISIMIFSVGHLSGAHFNPVVTLAFVAAKRIPPSAILIYWPSQIAGGLLAIFVLEHLKKI